MPADWSRLDYTTQLQRNNEKIAKELHFDESSRTSLTALSVLLHNAMLIFKPMGP
jgi:hypothetical protein